MAISMKNDADAFHGEGASKTARGRGRLSRRTIIIVAVTVTLAVIIALAVGLGVSLTRSDGDSADDAAAPSALPTPTVPSSNSTVWQPAAGSSWQIVLEDAIQLSTDAVSIDPDTDVLDIDLFTNPQSTIDTLHGLDKRVICYFSAGSYEPYRPDSSQFEPSDLGKTMDGWPDENWIDINSPNVRRIMADRIALASRKGCDAVDPDNIDGYNNENGLGLTPEDSINYMQYLASQASANGIAIGLKNAAEIVANVASIVQFSVNEECVEYSECGQFAPLIQAQKPVFHIEYAERDSSGVIPSGRASQFCSDTGDAAGRAGFSTVLKEWSLDGWVQFCNGTTATTPVVAG